MKTIGAFEQRIIEDEAAAAGTPAGVLMERAGRALAERIIALQAERGGPVSILCGAGNNGGDGFVIGRYALRDGFQTRVFLLCKASDLKGDAALNMGIYKSIGGKISECTDKTKGITDGIRDADIIIDAIFGTGLSKPVSGIEKAVIEDINISGKPVIAVDIPSGIDGKTGQPLGTAIRATHTFTYGYPKIGQILQPGAYHTGKLTVIDISMPSLIEGKLGFDGRVIEGAMVLSLIHI